MPEEDELEGYDVTAATTMDVVSGHDVTAAEVWRVLDVVPNNNGSIMVILYSIILSIISQAIRP